ncbi:MAG: restriction endonuclease subunit S, partial [Pseudohongiella sp.]|nr:restriction endonuclease subunit S [Pseudohongiella sp.]
MTNECPGWKTTTLGEVAEWGSGGTPSRSNSEFFNGSIPWIKTGELGAKFIHSAEERISELAIKKSSAKIFPAGSVCIAMYGATIGKLSIFAIDAATNQACAVAQPKKELLDKEFLYYYLLSQRKALVDAGKGGAQPNISQGTLKDWPITLPSVNEQKSIVIKIETLLSELDKGIESLKTVREQLKFYRQAVLKHAFEGKLTAHWREQKKDKLESPEQLLARIQHEREARYHQQLEEWKAAVNVWETGGKEGQKPGKPRRSELDKISLDRPDVLPAEWAWLAVGELDVNIFDGPFGSNLKSSDYVESGVRVIRLENIGYSEFIENKYSYVTEEK